MKRLFLCAIVSVASFTFIFSQSTFEVGPRITDWSGFGLIIKKELKNSNYLRLRTGSANLNSELVDNGLRYTTGLNVAIGLEKRARINPSLAFHHGFEPRLFLSSTLNAGENSFAGSVGVGYVLGLTYEINPSWILSLETIPGIDAFVVLRQGFSNVQLRGNGNLDRIGISLAHRFKKE